VLQRCATTWPRCSPDSAVTSSRRLDAPRGTWLLRTTLGVAAINDSSRGSEGHPRTPRRVQPSASPAGVAPRPADQMIVGYNPLNRNAVAFGIQRSHGHVERSGPDGADLALVEVRYSPHARRFDRIVLASGDHILCPSRGRVGLARNRHDPSSRALCQFSCLTREATRPGSRRPVPHMFSMSSRYRVRVTFVSRFRGAPRQLAAHPDPVHRRPARTRWRRPDRLRARRCRARCRTPASRRRSSAGPRPSA
jgi:hypothetical protein